MLLRRLIPAFVRRQFSPAFKYAVIRRMEDFPPSARFRLSPGLRRQAARERDRCRSFEDWFALTGRWLGAGSVQVIEEIRSAVEYLNTASPRRLCEIGTDYGGTSCLLARTVPTAELLICVDLFVKNWPRLKALCGPRTELRAVHGSSTSSRALARVERILAGRELDVLFIDGDHTYEGVRRDYLRYRRFLRQGGFVVFHDIVQDLHTRYGRPTAGWSGGVPTFWRELSAHFEHREFVKDPEQDGMGIGILRHDTTVALPGSLGAEAVEVGGESR